ncbi:unnamed protein product [Albugo candida]|uniref:Uncharacterized protein n=1 Tax=Albugo candida TaxID=65357 RepID=A0A024FWP5_9STRA|nr:unnamed protein product [Albugo candida]|eukprot:CCI11520.1 unnamed protein product [Albugo candida]
MATSCLCILSQYIGKRLKHLHLLHIVVNTVVIDAFQYIVASLLMDKCELADMLLQRHLYSHLSPHQRSHSYIVLGQRTQIVFFRVLDLHLHDSSLKQSFTIPLLIHAHISVTSPRVRPPPKRPSSPGSRVGIFGIFAASYEIGQCHLRGQTPTRDVTCNSSCAVWPIGWLALANSSRSLSRHNRT